MNTISEDLLPIWEELKDIFKDKKKLGEKEFNRLRKLGFKVVYNGKHPKMYIGRKGKTHCVVLHSTSSDFQAGNQILRMIRRVYEQY